MSRDPSAILLQAGSLQAVVSPRGASLRRYTVAGEPVVAAPERDEDAVREFAGSTLAPWPNRLGDGAWSWSGTPLRVPVTEEHTGTALHGLVAERLWTVTERRRAAVTLSTRLGQDPGYPFAVALTVRYRLGAAGLECVVAARNDDGRTVPIGLGSHPYLALRGDLDQIVLTVPAGQWLETDERGLPARRRHCAGSDHDFRAPTRLGARRLDTAFTALARDRRGRAVVRVEDAGRVVELWGDAACRWFMVYSGDTLPTPRRRRVLAVEPMSCPPDALRSGEDVIALRSGAVHRLEWGLAVDETEEAA